jgi:hypothetical protein
MCALLLYCNSESNITISNAKFTLRLNYSNPVFEISMHLREVLRIRSATPADFMPC